MKEKIHDLKTALAALRIEQTVSFDDCQKLMTDVHDKTGFTPPNFEISGNQWCVLVNLAVARFGNTTPPQQEPVVWMYQDKSTHEVRFQKHMRGFVDHGATYETPLYTTPPQRTEQNFCPRCGKRNKDIHTCTPPQE